MCDNNSAECDEFSSLNDEFLSEFISKHLHISLVTIFTSFVIFYFVIQFLRCCFLCATSMNNFN